MATVEIDNVYGDQVLFTNYHFNSSIKMLPGNCKFVSQGLFVNIKVGCCKRFCLPLVVVWKNIDSLQKVMTKGGSQGMRGGKLEGRE